jgi:hypothetical protein
VQVYANDTSGWTEDEFGNIYDVEFTKYCRSISSIDPLFEKANNGISEILFLPDDYFNGDEREFAFKISQGEYDYYSELYVQIESLSEEMYLYYKSKAQYLEASSNPFAEPFQMYSNVDNGLGIFAAYTDTVLPIQ